MVWIAGILWHKTSMERDVELCGGTLTYGMCDILRVQSIRSTGLADSKEIQASLHSCDPTAAFLMRKKTLPFSWRLHSSPKHDETLDKQTKFIANQLEHTHDRMIITPSVLIHSTWTEHHEIDEGVAIGSRHNNKPHEIAITISRNRWVDVVVSGKFHHH